MLGCHGDDVVPLDLRIYGFWIWRAQNPAGRMGAWAPLRGADLLKTQPPALTKNHEWEVVSAGGDLEGRWHVGISIERPRGYLRNRFRN